MSYENSRFERLFDRPEQKADNAILRGDFETAKNELENAVGRSSERNELAMAKWISLPLFEHERNLIQEVSSSEQTLRDAETCHAHMAELLRVVSQRMQHEDRASARYSDDLGLASELTFLTLGARRFNRAGDYFMLPSTLLHDNAGKYAYDMRLIANTPRPRSLSLQVKTGLSQKHYSSVVRIISASDLDPTRARQPYHPQSLASQLIAEIDGATDSSIVDSLNQAEATMFEKLGLLRRLPEPADHQDLVS